jgi:hypothetical protein
MFELLTYVYIVQRKQRQVSRVMVRYDCRVFFHSVYHFPVLAMTFDPFT